MSVVVCRDVFAGFFLVTTGCRLRSCVRLQGQYFIVNNTRSGEEQDVTPAPRNVEAAHDLLLTASQFSTLAHALRSASLAAPAAVESGIDGYRFVPAACVIDVIERLASGGKLPPAWSRLAPSTLWAFVRSFRATQASDLVDWQALCCALVVAAGHGAAVRSASGAALGTCATRWPTDPELAAMERAFKAHDNGAVGLAPIEALGDVHFWFEGEGLNLEEEEAPVEVGMRVQASFRYPSKADGWHNVTRDHPSAGSWQQAEAAYMAAVGKAVARTDKLVVR